MNTLVSFKKELSVLVLLAGLFAIDLLHISDLELKYTLMGLITLLTGYHGYMDYESKKGPEVSQ